MALMVLVCIFIQTGIGLGVCTLLSLLGIGRIDTPFCRMQTRDRVIHGVRLTIL